MLNIITFLSLSTLWNLVCDCQSGKENDREFWYINKISIYVVNTYQHMSRCPAYQSHLVVEAAQCIPPQGALR
jgi:hypothetical protein